MTKLHHITNDEAMNAYRYTLTGERLGWVIFSHPASFSPTHQVLLDPEAGPVIIVYDEVWEVDPDLDDVFLSEEMGRDAYWERKR